MINLLHEQYHRIQSLGSDVDDLKARVEKQGQQQEAQAGPAIAAPMGNPLMLPAAPTGMTMASSPSFGGM